MTSLARLRVPENTQAKMGANKKRSPTHMKYNQQRKHLRGGYCSLFATDNLMVDDGMDIQSNQTTSPMTSSKTLHNSTAKRNLNFSGNSSATPIMDIDDEHDQLVEPLILRKRKHSTSNAPENNYQESNTNGMISTLPVDTPIIFDDDVFKFLDDISTQDSDGFAALLRACDSLSSSPIKTTPCPSPSTSQPTPSSTPSNNNNNKKEDIQESTTTSQTPPNDKSKSPENSMIKSPMSPMSSPPTTPVRYNKYAGMSKETIEAVMDFDKFMRSTENLLQTIYPPSSSVVENSWLSPSRSPRKKPTISEIEKRIDRAVSESIQVTDDKPGASNLERIFTVYGHKYYTVVISNTPSCSCPDNCSGRSGFHCKHILFVLVNVLKVQRNDPCLFRKELLNSELYAMFYPDTLKPAPKVSLPIAGKVVENEDGTMVLEPELEVILDSQLKELETEPQAKRTKLIDERRGNVPNFLKDFKPGVYTPPKNKQRELADPHPLVARNKVSMQEYLCRDCKKPFCRKGDRDNHELRMGHTRWRKGENRQLTTL